MHDLIVPRIRKYHLIPAQEQRKEVKRIILIELSRHEAYVQDQDVLHRDDAAFPAQ